MTYEKYCADMQRFGVEPAYKTEEEFNRAHRITTDDYVPLVITPRNQKRPVAPTLEEHEKPKKKPKPPKPKAVAQKRGPKPKKSMTQEEKAEHSRKIKADYRQRLVDQGLTTKGLPRKRTRVMTEEEKKQYKAEYMKKWRKTNSESARAVQQTWVENNRDKKNEANRRWYQNKKLREANLQAQEIGTTTTKP